MIAISYFADNWRLVYSISGTLGLISLALSLGYFLDGMTLGNKGSFLSSKETRKIGRAEDSKRFISIAIPNLLAALVYIVI